MFIHAYIDASSALLNAYTGAEPFHIYVKKFFATQKKYGSRDRKHIIHLCYCYFRLGHLFKTHTLRDRLTIGLFLCSEAPNALLAALHEDWNAMAALPAIEKIKVIDADAEAAAIFPFNNELSPAIDKNAFNLSFLVQPLVYLRIRPGHQQKVVAALQKNAIAFEMINDHCIAVSSQTKVDAVLEMDKAVVVQDANSQRVLESLAKIELPGTIKVWDCCAASGGKSILLMDSFAHVQLTVSDVRASILHNLKNRFAKGGIKNYHWFVGDAAASGPPQKEKFDVIICDAPCSGSGTWGRTPEQLHFFTEEKITHYARLQKSIVANVYKSLKPGGYLLYITCSVFTKENEAVVDFIKEELGLTLLHRDYYKGYQSRADTLFAALFRLA